MSGRKSGIHWDPNYSEEQKNLQLAYVFIRTCVRKAKLNQLYNSGVTVVREATYEVPTRLRQTSGIAGGTERDDSTETCNCLV